MFNSEATEGTMTPQPSYNVQAFRREYNAAGEVVAVVVIATSQSTGERPLKLHSTGGGDD